MTYDKLSDSVYVGALIETMEAESSIMKMCLEVLRRYRAILLTSVPADSGSFAAPNVTPTVEQVVKAAAAAEHHR